MKAISYQPPRFSRSLRPLVLALCLMPLAAQAAADVLEQTSAAFSRLAEKAMPGVVSIRVEKTVALGQPGSNPVPFNNPLESFGEDFLRRFFPGQGRSFGRPPQQRSFKQQGAGSGFLISEEGYILSNNHVVGDADAITVKLHDGREFAAERIGTDPKSEVALIKIDGDDFAYLDLADSTKIKVGQWVVAIGNPFGLSGTLTTGVISAKGRSNIGIADYEDFIQTDAAINPGNSGGPLLNTEGEVIGINTAIYSRSGGYMGIGFAIPINMAKYVKDQLIESGKVVRSYLGISIQEVTPELAKSFELDAARGILVAGVVDDAGADRAGIQSGDIILELNGEEVGNVGDFRNQVAINPPGTSLSLTISRNGKSREIEAVTGTFPDPDQTLGSTETTAEDFGFTLQNLSADLARRFNYQSDRGVVISQVRYGSPAAAAGLRPGHLITSVNRQAVSNVTDFQKALAASAESGRVLLHVEDERGSRFVVLQQP